MEKKKKPIKGIRIQTLNMGMIVLSCVLYVLLITATIHSSARYDTMVSSTEGYIVCQQNAEMVREGSDYLTSQVQHYTVTMDEKYMQNYFEEVYTTRRREAGLNSLEQYASEAAAESLRTALAHSDQLMEQEIYAMRLIAEANGVDPSLLHEDVGAVTLSESDQALSPQEMIAQAQELTFGQSYQDAKALIDQNVELFLQTVMEDTHKTQQDSTEELGNTMRRQQVLISILFVESIITFVMIIVLIVKPLQIYIECIKEEKELEITGSYEFKYLALTYNDIYEINAANETMLRHKAEHDPLTGLMNRGAFDQIKQVMRTKAAPLALLIVDVDKFKQVNDGYGHEMGDRVLKNVARLLEKSFRSTDFPARVGGDEFSVLLTDTTPEQKTRVLEKIGWINRQLLEGRDGMPPVSLSVGGAFSPSGYTDDLYKKADLALYHVKENGRCGCAFYDESMES